MDGGGKTSDGNRGECEWDAKEGGEKEVDNQLGGCGGAIEGVQTV